jgi:hypothetical protein
MANLQSLKQNLLVKVNVVVKVRHVLKLYGCGEIICDLPRSP